MQLFIGVYFFSDVYFKPSLFSIQSSTQSWRFANKNKKNAGDKMGFIRSLKVIVKMKLKGKKWG
jgi:hypothetical protein